MAGTKFSDYLGLNHYKKAKKLKHFIHYYITTTLSLIQHSHFRGKINKPLIIFAPSDIENAYEAHIS